ncbi:MAG: hypothetical protein FRX48_05129 [Lasallia pustulata]|uniref:BHLH domain-containing protein n=1 Tax=Lasallia pustulata TaxID=136370 RepID=A0A5M8PMR4_9LECA|nr:MAG: hypothetical protein FRX48_05129 [Lasallia pustulata]
MPRPGLPPTPASSTDIMGKDNSRLSSLETSFALPPPAIASAGSDRSSSTSVASSLSDSSYHPVSPTSPALTTAERSRKRSSSGQQQRPAMTTSDFSLPPPPTRSRKIIQMKPRAQQSHDGVNEASPQITPKGPSKKAGAGSHTQPTAASTKKQPSSTSVAGRKIARKTAHSLIERRRRSKMNEEFGVLKDMIPACKDQEMHKLAILQASIDYLRYLEQCVADLKAANRTPSASCPPPSHAPTPSHHPIDSNFPGEDAIDDDDDEDEDEDVEMEMEDSATNTSSAPLSAQSQPYHSFQSHSNTASPDLPPTHHPISLSYSSAASTIPSPAFGPQEQQNQYSYQRQSQQYQTYNPAFAHSASTSPALLPMPEGMRDSHQEAMAALLMLNTDRRDSKPRGIARGMSVKDLLSG